VGQQVAQLHGSYTMMMLLKKSLHLKAECSGLLNVILKKDQLITLFKEVVTQELTISVSLLVQTGS
jgi:uncharacterized membrane protein